MVVADFRELLAVPYRPYALFENVADVGALESIEATNRHSAVVVNGQGLVEGRAGQSLFRRFHVRKGSIFEQQIDAHAVNQTAPELDKCRFLVTVLVLKGERDADARQVAIAPRRQ